MSIKARPLAMRKPAIGGAMTPAGWKPAALAAL